MKVRYLPSPAVLLILIVLLITLASWLRRPQTESARQSSPSSRAIQAQMPDPAHGFAGFDAWIDTFKAAAPANRGGLTAEGLALARERRAQMETLIRNAPQEALAHAVSLDVWQSLPAELQAEVEEPFSAIGNFSVLPVCITGSPDAARLTALGKIPDAIRRTEIEGRPPLISSVFGRRQGLSTKRNSPIQGIRLGDFAALREEVFHPLKPQETAVAESLYPISNPDPNRDFSTGQALGPEPVSALSGGRIFKFSDAASLAAFDKSIATLDEKPGPHGGAGLLFLPMPADGDGSAFNLAEAIQSNNVLASSWTETKKKVFMIRCDFSDHTNAANPVVDAGSYGSLLNTTVSDTIRDFSYGKTWIEATVSGSITRLPQTASYYTMVDASQSSRNAQLLSDAKAAYASANPGWSATTYNIVGVWFGNIGMRGANLTYAGLAGGGDLWIQNNTDADVHVHEFGHNYGIGHSSFWKPSVGSTNPVDPAGTYEEYGDPFDVMGSGDVPAAVFHSEAKTRLNWLSTGEWTDATASGSGTYRIHRIDHPNTIGVRGLRITKGSNEFYWLSYRRLFDNASLKAGANLIWQRNGFDRSWLIDTTPGSLAGSEDRTDGALTIGRTYSDTAANVHITALGRGGSGPGEYLDLKINLGAFAGNGAPVVTLNGPATVPARQTCIFTAQATDPNGDTLAYSWDFGTGFTFDNHASAPFAWSSGGTYTVKVRVSDMKGRTTLVTKTVTVTDAINTWSNRANSATGDFNALVASPDKVIAVGENFTGSFRGPVATSSDGITWTATELGQNQQTYGGVWDGSQFLLAGMDYNLNSSVNAFVGCIFTSPSANAGTWTRRIYAGPPLKGIAFGGGVYVAVGDGGTILRSTDAINWSPVAFSSPKNLKSVAYGGGKFIIVGHPATISGDAIVLSSSDGNSWQNITAGAGLLSWHDLRQIAWTHDRFITSGYYSKIRHSVDSGVSFVTTRTPAEELYAVAYGNGVWFATGTDLTNSNAAVDLVSSNGASWTSMPANSSTARSAAVFFKNTFITAGDIHSIRQSGVIQPSAIGYYNWRESFFPDRGPGASPNDDQDGDSLNNLLEYALGSSPVSSAGLEGPGVLPQATIASSLPLLTGRLALQFSLPDPAPADFGYVVEVAGALDSSWTPLATKTGTGAWTWNPGGTSRIVIGASAGGKTPVTIGDVQAISAATKRFLRLRTFVNP